MKLRSIFASLSLMSLALSLSACETNSPDRNALEIPELGIAVMNDKGYTMKKVNEDGVDVFRIFDGEKGLADFEEQENYGIDESTLKSLDNTKAFLDSSGQPYTILEEEMTDYGAALMYETPDLYVIVVGIQYEELRVVCQATPRDETTQAEFKEVFEICKTAVPLEVYENM